MLGERFVGPGFTEPEPGLLRSADGLRQFRGPSEKPTGAGRNVHPVSGQPYSATGVQVNFETRPSTNVGFNDVNASNVHLDVQR